MRRLKLRVTSCGPVGYGMICSCGIASSEGHERRGTLDSCVSTALYDRLQKAPLVGTPGTPLSLELDAKPASAPDGGCGVLVLDSGKRLRVQLPR